MIPWSCQDNGQSTDAYSLRSIMPVAIDGFEAIGEPEFYDRDGIFKYMDGAGEIYRMYNFRQLEVMHLAQLDAPVISVEMFDMTTPADAFGVFSHVREEPEAGVGQGSEYRSGVLVFWQGRYFFSITTEMENESARAVMFHVAQFLSGRIKSAEGPPSLVQYLPGENLIAESVRFFRQNSSLNYHYFLADSNILHLGDQTEAVLAEYEPGQTYLLCIKYPGAAEALSAYENFLKTYLPDSSASGIKETQPGKWAVAENAGEFNLIVLDVSDPEIGRTLISRSKENIARMK